MDGFLVIFLVVSIIVFLVLIVGAVTIRCVPRKPFSRSVSKGTAKRPAKHRSTVAFKRSLPQTECRTNADCAGDNVCQHAKILHLEKTADDIPSMHLSGEQLSSLDLLELTANNLNVADVQEYSPDQERYLIISTDTKQLLVHQPGNSRLVASTIAAHDLALAGNRLYATEHGKLYFANLAQQFSADTWTFQKVKGLHGNVLTISSPHDNSTVLVVVTGAGTYHLRNGVVTRHDLGRDLRVYGKTSNEFAVMKRGGGIDVFPNSEHVELDGLCTITEENRFFHIDQKANEWVKRIRSIMGEPVLISRAVCQPPTSDLPRTVA